MMPRKIPEKNRPQCPKCEVGKMNQETEIWEGENFDGDLIFYIFKCPYCNYKVRL